MNIASLSALERLVALGRRSLLQYISESSPYTTDKTHDALTHILAMAQEERDAVGKLIRYLQKKHVRRIVLGSYPSHYTMMNFITIDCLLPRLIAAEEVQVAEIERCLASAADEEIRTMIQAHLDMKRRHLQTLKDLSQHSPLAA
jgi:hypothetical protein